MSIVVTQHYLIFVLLSGVQPLLLILPWTTIAQGLMRAFLVIPANPATNCVLCLTKAPKRLLPYALFFQRSEPALNHAILFRRIGRNKLLREPIKATCIPKTPTLEDQPIVTAYNGHCTIWPQCPEPCQARHFERPFRFISPSA